MFKHYINIFKSINFIETVLVKLSLSILGIIKSMSNAHFFLLFFFFGKFYN